MTGEGTPASAHLPNDEPFYPWPSWKVTNPKGRVGSVIGVCVFGALLAGAIIWWPLYTVALLALIEALAVLRLYQEWVEKGAWAK